MSLGYATFVLPIAADQSAALARYLQQNAEPPSLDETTGKLTCRPEFRFDQIRTLHFCSFLILSPVDEKRLASLVFEATFDGPEDDFLDELIRLLPVGLHAVLAHCAGYPRSGMAVPDLVKAFLRAHDAGAHTFFTGSPGRGVAQIGWESGLRDALARFLSRRSNSATTPVSLAGLQAEMQREVVHTNPEWRWAEQKAAEPWEVALRWLVVASSICAAAALAAGLGAFVLASAGAGPQKVASLLDPGVTAARQFGQWLLGSDWPAVRWLGDAIESSRMSCLYALLALAAVWLGLRVVNFVLSSLTEDPRAQNFVLRFPLHIVVILRYAVLFALIGSVALVGVTLSSQQKAPDLAPRFASYIKLLDQNLTIAKLTSVTGPRQVHPAVLASFVLLFGTAIVLALLQYWATSLRLSVQFAELSPARENVRRFLLDVLHLGMGLAAIFAVFVIARHVPNATGQWLADAFNIPVRVVLVLAIYVFSGALIAYLALALPLFLLVRALEIADRRRFASAARLVGLPLVNGDVIAREERGTNRYQNYLASLTEVKPGLIRRTLLRLTLFSIHLLSRFWFNRGDLGEISTILSARWVLIDGGRRLLFLDNYTGGWESYLNEFMDMAAVKGLNAIWTNTFIRTAGPRLRYSFPETKFYLWKGAQAERPFKAYVRQSQIETIVWYGAYPKLSIKNINVNTNVRQAMFKPLAEHELDGVVQHL